MIIIMLGAPGTGKGTVAGILTGALNIPQISTGDIFRQQISEGTELGKLADSYISKGHLVPDEVTVQLVEARLSQDDVKNGAILDGFPRTVKQAKELDRILAKLNEKVNIAINLETPEQEIIDRIVNRRVCSNCKAIYNLLLNPPKDGSRCDKCGGELIQRKDDNEETIKRRLKTYFDQTSPLIEFYKNKQVLITETVSQSINKMGMDVAKEIVEFIKGEKI